MSEDKKELLWGIFGIIMFFICISGMIALSIWGASKIEVEQPKKCIEFSAERQVWVDGERFNSAVWFLTGSVGWGMATAEKGRYITKRDCLKWE